MSAPPMKTRIEKCNEVTIKMPLNEFLTLAGLPDPENYECRNGSTFVTITVHSKDR